MYYFRFLSTWEFCLALISTELRYIPLVAFHFSCILWAYNFKNNYIMNFLFIKVVALFFSKLLRPCFSAMKGISKTFLHSNVQVLVLLSTLVDAVLVLPSVSVGKYWHNIPCQMVQYCGYYMFIHCSSLLSKDDLVFVDFNKLLVHLSK